MNITTSKTQGAEQALLQTLRQLQHDPRRLSEIPGDRFPEGSPQRLLLDEFARMLSLTQQREEALTRSVESYEHLLDSLGTIVWEGDADTFAFTFVSKQAERLLGYPVERWINEPTFWQDHIHADDREWAPAFCAGATSRKEAHAFEYRMIASDGRIVWLRDIVTVILENDRPATLRGVMVDITEQKAGEVSLREREEQYRSIFEATGEGLIINDMDGIIVEANPAACRMHGYTREEMIGLNVVDFHAPHDRAVTEDYMQTVKSGKSFQNHEDHLHFRKDGTSLHVEVQGSTFIYKGEPHILGVIRDITDRVQAYEMLEQRVDERTQELSTLLEVSHNVASTLDRDRLVSSILDQLKVVADYTGSAILVREGDGLTLLDIRGANTDAKIMIGRRVSSGSLGVMWESFRAGEPVILDDVRGSDAMAQAYRESVAELMGTTSSAVAEMLHGPFSYDRSFLAVPLTAKEQMVGILTLTHNEPGYYTPRRANLAKAIANQAAVAIENARLYEEAQETARSMAALAQIASRAAFGGSLEATLSDICEHVVKATGGVAASVALFNVETEEARMISTYGLPDGYADAMNIIVGSGTKLMTHEAFYGRKPMFLPDAKNRILSNPAYAPLHPYLQSVRWNTIVAVPMVYHAKPVGVLFSYHASGREIGEAEITFHTAIADQAAVAVENARLLVEVEKKAAIEQRHHLARELHDSVSQALFSINLTARSLETVLQREGVAKEGVDSRLSDLRQLTQGAMAEMRALIMELRPGGLEEEGLLAALRKHAAAVQGREMLQVDVVTHAEALPRLKPTAEEALYRIAQEALHNIVKHAHAHKVEISLCVDTDTAEERVLTLSVVDDGVGFELGSVPAGHMGLGTMGQRAAALGGQYTVRSAPGHGTTVTVQVPIDRWVLPG